MKMKQAQHPCFTCLARLLHLTQHSRFVAVAPRPLAHFAFAMLRQNVGYAGNVI